jgi:hypothetical protein
MKTTYLFTAALAAALAGVGGARADFVTYEITGKVSTLVDYSPGHNQLPADIHVGDALSGTFSYNTDAPGSSVYRGTALQMSIRVTIDGHTFALTSSTASDEIDLLSIPPFGYYKRGPEITTDFGTPLSFASLNLGGNGTTDLSKFQPSLNYFDNSVGLSDAGSASPYWFIGGSVDTLAPVAAVPAPSGLVLGGIAALCLGGCALRYRASPHAAVWPAN